MSKNSRLYFDVMLRGRFVCTMSYEYCSLWPIELQDIVDLVLKKRPTLKDQPFEIKFNQ